MIARAMKEWIVLVILLVSAAGCSSTYESSRTVVVRGNLAEPTWYGVTGEMEAPDGGPTVLRCTVLHDDKPVSGLRLGNRPTVLEVALSQESVPFSLFKEQRFKGSLLMAPRGSPGPSLKVPFEVGVKSWVDTHWVGLLIPFSLLNGFWLLNMAMLLFKTEVRGTVELLSPARPSWPMCPPSRINHFTRDLFTIGTGKRDDYPVEDCPELEEQHIKLKFFLGGAESGPRSALKARIHTKTNVYYKIGKPARIADPAFKGKKEYTPYVWDFTLTEEDFVDVLRFRGYAAGNKLEIGESEPVILVLNKETVLKIEI